MSGRLMVMAAALAGVMLTAGTGCVSREEYNKALAAADRANEALTLANQQLAEVRRQNQDLRGEIADRDALLANKDKVMANLEQANADLSDQYKKLKALYDKEIGREAVLGPTIALPQPLHQKLMKWAQENSDLVEYDAKRGMVKLKADLTFDPGSIDIKPTALPALKKLAEILDSPEAVTFHVYTAGHTDDIPVTKTRTVELHGSNWGLSVHRALAVIKALFESGVDQRRMAAMGFSMYHPIAPNAPGRKGNALNRRVELWIIPPDKFLTAKEATPAEAPVPAPAPAPVMTE